jgi:hypothetical protein
MQVKKEETYQDDDGGGYRKKYDINGSLVFEEHYGGGVNYKRKIVYKDKNKIEKEEIIHCSQSKEGDLKTIKKYEYYENGYRIYTIEIGKRDIYAMNSLEYILEGKELWESLNNLFCIEEFNYKDDKLQSITKHQKDEKGGFITTTTYKEDSFTKKNTQNGLNKTIEIISPVGSVVEKITENENDQIVRKEVYNEDGSINTTILFEWYPRSSCILQKSKTSTQYIKGRPTWNYTEIRLFNKEGILIASKHYEYDTVTKTIYDNKGNEINSYTYEQLKSNIKEEWLIEYSVNGYLELEVYYRYSRRKKHKIYTKKIYYY